MTHGLSRDWPEEGSEQEGNEIKLMKYTQRRTSEPPVGPKNLEIPCSDIESVPKASKASGGNILSMASSLPASVSPSRSST